MKQLALIKFAFALLVVGASAPTPAHAEESLTVNATLVLGVNEGEGVDSSLRQYERELKRLLPFDTFKRIGSGRASVSLPGQAAISVGGGQSVSIKVEPAERGKYRISSNWKTNGRSVNTTVLASRNRPTAIGGPSSGDGAYILILIAN